MSEESRIRICRAFFISLIFLLSTGCATPQPHRVLGRHLENYRKVYLAKSKEDPRKVSPRIFSRLQLAGFDVTEVPFEGIKALNKEAAEKRPSEPTLVCIVDCVSMQDFHFDNLYSFQTIRIVFYDLEKADLVFRVSKFDYYSTLPENTELNRLFIQISDAFFPGKPNPFKGKK